MRGPPAHRVAPVFGTETVQQWMRSETRDARIEITRGELECLEAIDGGQAVLCVRGA